MVSANLAEVVPLWARDDGQVHVTARRATCMAASSDGVAMRLSQLRFIGAHQ